MTLHFRVFALVIAAAGAMQAANIYTVAQVMLCPDVIACYGNGINDAGQVVGTEALEAQFWGFLYPDGNIASTSLDGPATAINNSGAITGYSSYYGGSAFISHAYVISGGVETELELPAGYQTSQAYAINDNGQVVGAMWGPSLQAFLYSGGVVTGLGYLMGFSGSWASSINNSGQVAGFALSDTGFSEAFLYSAGVMTGLGYLTGYNGSSAAAINDKGQIVGTVGDAGGSEAFLYGDGVMMGLGTLPGDSVSGAAAINNKGQVVGSSALGYARRAFLYSGGRMVDLNSLVVDSPGFWTATAINDSGQIVVNKGWVGVYLLTPLRGRFVPVAPCRVADTRTSFGPLGGPALENGVERSFAIPQGPCGIPANAQAYSLNVTAVPRAKLGYLTVWPTGLAQPFVSTLNSYEGNVVANAALVPAGKDGAISVYANAEAPTDVVLDINGYFDAAAGDSFYPVQPCRVADTRQASGPLGGPSLAAGEIRVLPILESPCGLPPAATAYSTNITVVPQGYLGYLTTWPTGQAQPFVSTLNSPGGQVVANAAIVPAGIQGSVSVYVTNPTDVVLDVNGYFAPPGSPGALSFYPILPCRAVDTRSGDSFSGEEMETQQTRTYAIPAAGCEIPADAAAYSLNITVVPDGPLSYLTAWPTGSQQPVVSTLNSMNGSVVANAAIVPAGAGGAIDIYVTDRTHVILDINGYFAP